MWWVWDVMGVRLEYSELGGMVLDRMGVGWMW